MSAKIPQAEGRPVVEAATPASGRCPVCGRPATAATRPFCTRRCADIDLHRWLGEVYRIPVSPDTDDAHQDDIDEENRSSHNDDR